MNTPNIKFKFSPTRDCEIAWAFYQTPLHGGVNFWQRGALQYHDELDLLVKMKKPKEFLSNYVSDLYKKHQVEFEQRGKEISSLYESQADRFFVEVKKLFKNHPWPKGKYIAYLSIFDFCPRFLDDKTFFVFMYDNDNDILFTIFHEMLHFIFYDYCLKSYPWLGRKLDTERGKFWALAELFNAIIQGTPAFARLHGPRKGIGYPDLTLDFKTAKKAWGGNVDEWLEGFGRGYLI
jgi:hypothetical protein